MTTFASDRTSSNKAGVTLMNNQVGYVVAGVMRDKEGVTVTELPSMIRVDGVGKVDFDFEEIDGFDGSIHKQTWQEDPIWQPTRELVEGLTGIRDWAEALFATTIVFEQLVGELFRSGFVMQVAAPHGDFVTPTIMGAGESDAAREQRGARALFRMLTDDAEHGASNKEVMQAWLGTYVPQAVEAARNLQPIWSQLSEKTVRFEDSYERSSERFGELLTHIGLETPKGVTA